MHVAVVLPCSRMRRDNADRGVQPDLTIFGPAVESSLNEKGGAGLFENTMIGRLANPQARIPGYDTGILLPDLMVVRQWAAALPPQRFRTQSRLDYSPWAPERTFRWLFTRLV